MYKTLSDILFRMIILASSSSQLHFLRKRFFVSAHLSVVGGVAKKKRRSGERDSKTTSEKQYSSPYIDNLNVIVLCQAIGSAFPDEGLI